MVALPLSLPIAIASGAPPDSRLVTAIIAGFLISARGSSRVQIGERIPVAELVHAATALAVMLLAAPMARQMAMPALAGLLVPTARNMSEPHKWRGYLRTRPSDRFLLILTLFLTVVADLTIAIGTGIDIGLALRLSRRGVPPAESETPDR